MRIFDIINEAKFAKEKKYFYHGTSGAYLRSILKHGLIPNKMEGGYGSDETDSRFNISLTPLAGVYLSKDKGHASIAAKEASYKTNNDALIFVVKAQEREAFVDEDYVSLSLHNELSSNIRKFIQEEGYEISDEVFDTFIEQQVKICLQIIWEKMVNPSNKEHFKKLKLFLQKDLRSYITILANSAFDESDADVKAEQDILTKRLRTLNYGDTPSKSIRIEKVIGFSGATKIVGIYNYDNGLYWGDVGALPGKYEVKHPMQILQKT